MSLVLQITSGSRAGQRTEFTKSVVVVGRHPDCDLRFDAHKDLDVSTRHAELRGAVNGWAVLDLGSTNGTFVNGTKTTGPQNIRTGDVIMFGSSGPRVEVVGTGVVDLSAPPRTQMRDSVGTPSRPKTEERIAIAVAKQTGSLKKFVIGLGIVVIVGVGALVAVNQRSASQANALIATLVARNDSLAGALQHSLTDANTRAAGFDSVARILKVERDRLSRELKSGGDVANITSQLDALQRRGDQALLLTNRQISDLNGKAVGEVIVQSAKGVVEQGTAFVVTADGLMVTNEHVVMEDGHPPVKVGVYMADTDNFIPAHFVSAVSNADLAFIQLDVPAKYPTVRGVGASDNVGSGDPVIVIGFPLGTAKPQPGSTMKTTLTAGLVSSANKDEIKINAFAAQGSSGSPVFDSRGYVIGVLNSGQGGASSVITFIVPSAHLIANLPANAKSIVKP